MSHGKGTSNWLLEQTKNKNNTFSNIAFGTYFETKNLKTSNNYICPKNAWDGKITNCIKKLYNLYVLYSTRSTFAFSFKCSQNNFLQLFLRYLCSFKISHLYLTQYNQISCSDEDDKLTNLFQIFIRISGI